MVSGKVQWACTAAAFNSTLKSMYGFNIDSLALCVCQSCGSLRARVCKAAAYPPPHLYFLSNIKYMHRTIFGDVLCANDKQAARRWELLTSAAPFSRPRWGRGGGVGGSFASQQQMVIPATYATGFDTRTRGMHTWRRSFVRSLEREFKKRIFFFKSHRKHGKTTNTWQIGSDWNFCAPTLSVFFADLLLESALGAQPPPRTHCKRHSTGVIFCDRRKVLPKREWMRGTPFTTDSLDVQFLFDENPFYFLQTTSMEHTNTVIWIFLSIQIQMIWSHFDFL